MAAIFLYGLPTGESNEKKQKLVAELQKAVAAVRLLKIKPDQVAVHAPLDQLAPVSQREITTITVETKGVTCRDIQLINGNVINVLTSKIGRTLLKLYPSVRNIIILPPELCLPSTVTTFKGH